MCKKSKFPLVFNIFLAFFITLVVTIFVKAGEGALTPESFIIGMIQGFCLNMTLETIIDLPAMGNKFVRALGVKKMEGPAAYFLRLLAIVFVIVLLISFLLMFCEIGFAMGAGFFGFWITKVPAIFVVAYITAAIVFIPVSYTHLGEELADVEETLARQSKAFRLAQEARRELERLQACLLYTSRCV